jgi:hypothetical protein
MPRLTRPEIMAAAEGDEVGEVGRIDVHGVHGFGGTRRLAKFTLRR